MGLAALLEFTSAGGGFGVWIYKLIIDRAGFPRLVNVSFHLDGFFWT